MPRAPMAVPNASETTVSARCTAKKAVMPCCQERGSCQMFFRKTGQITQLQTPNTIRNQATRLEISTGELSTDCLNGVAAGLSWPVR